MWEDTVLSVPQCESVLFSIIQKMGFKTENIFFLGLTFGIKEDKLDSQFILPLLKAGFL